LGPQQVVDAVAAWKPPEEEAIMVPLTVSRATLGLCATCAVGNAFLYLTDPNYPPVRDDSWWLPILTVAAVYALFGALAWTQRRSLAGASVVALAVCLAAALLLWGRGMDWYGSNTIPNYYNQVMRLGSLVGGLGQLACLGVAAAGALAVRVGQPRE
jgi:hypothetical protein